MSDLATFDEAQALTQEIKDRLERHERHAAQVVALLFKADETQAWKALRYNSMASYIEKEFGYSRRNSYYIIDQYQALKLSAPVAQSGDLPTKREAEQARQERTQSERETVPQDVGRVAPKRSKRPRTGPPGLLGYLERMDNIMLTLDDEFERAGDDVLDYLPLETRRKLERTVDRAHEWSEGWIARLTAPRRVVVMDD